MTAQRILHLALIAALCVSAAACGNSRDGRGGDGSVPRMDAGMARTDAGGDFGYCMGAPSSGVEECRENTDCECGACTLGSICGGAGCAAECGSDDDCTDGWCSGGCCPYCIPSCPGMPCAGDTVCDMATGRCDPIQCDAGFTCPTNTRCDVTATGADARGCVRLSCTSETDCDCGTCAQGRCWNRPGQCCPPLPG